jgi:hypothetical protein
MKITIRKTLNGFHAVVEEREQAQDYVWREIDYPQMLEKLAFLLTNEKIVVKQK